MEEEEKPLDDRGQGPVDVNGGCRRTARKRAEQRVEGQIFLPSPNTKTFGIILVHVSEIMGDRQKLDLLNKKFSKYFRISD